MTKKSRISEY